MQRLIILHTAGEDYITDVITVVVPAGNGPTEVLIPIIDDEIKENLEQYFVGVLGISGDSIGTRIGANNTILLVIEDDESKCTRVGLREAEGFISMVSQPLTTPFQASCN